MKHENQSKNIPVFVLKLRQFKMWNQGNNFVRETKKRSQVSQPPIDVISKHTIFGDTFVMNFLQKSASQQPVVMGTYTIYIGNSCLIFILRGSYRLNRDLKLLLPIFCFYEDVVRRTRVLRHTTYEPFGATVYTIYESSLTVCSL